MAIIALVCDGESEQATEGLVATSASGRQCTGLCRGMFFEPLTLCFFSVKLHAMLTSAYQCYSLVLMCCSCSSSPGCSVRHILYMFTTRVFLYSVLLVIRAPHA